MSYTFTDIPISENYVVEEVRVSRYDLDDISIDVNGVAVDTTQADSGGALGSRTETANADTEFYPLWAEVNLKLKPNGFTVTLYNEKENYKEFNHITSVKNVIDVN